MNIQFSKPLADAKNFPSPSIKGLPSLKLQNLNYSISSFTQNIIKTAVFTLNARNGLALIGQQLCLNNEQSILLPAYHCPALVEPFVWLGVNIRFYKLNRDLSVDLEDFKNKIDHTTKACVIVRFFGFAINLDETQQVAKSQGLIIIEDWAHCFFGQLKNIPKNHRRDFAVASCNKFFPSIDGGLVWGLKNPPSDMKKVALLNEIKSFVNIFHFFDKTLSFLKKTLKKPNMTNDLPSAEMRLAEPAGFRYFLPDTVKHSCLWFSKIIIKHSNYENLIQLRQSNFNYLLEHLSDTPIGKPLYSQLPNDTVPYVFPFILNEARHFDDIKHTGLALFRWEELAESDCPTSKYYRQHLIQIPCHQTLSQADLENIVKIIKNLIP